LSDYLDASILLPTLVTEDASTAVDACLDARAQELLVSDFAAAEVASGLSRLVRMRLLEPAVATGHLEDFEVWRAARTAPADIRDADMRLAYAYVKRFELKLKAPDALHLALARRLDAVLVTLDRPLANAAAALGIHAFVPGRDSVGDPG
jgi:predicted nucleic acid-binding protein